MHDIQVQVNKTNFEGSKSIEIASLGMILATNQDELVWIEGKTYKQVGHIHIPMIGT
jgi:hypothetical protein